MRGVTCPVRGRSSPRGARARCWPQTGLPAPSRGWASSWGIAQGGGNGARGGREGTPSTPGPWGVEKGPRVPWGRDSMHPGTGMSHTPGPQGGGRGPGAPQGAAKGPHPPQESNPMHPKEGNPCTPESREGTLHTPREGPHPPRGHRGWGGDPTHPLQGRGEGNPAPPRLPPALPVANLFLTSDMRYPALASSTSTPDSVLPSLLNWAATGLGLLGPQRGSQLAESRPQPAGWGTHTIEGRGSAGARPRSPAP